MTTEFLKPQQLHTEDVKKQVKMPAQASILPQQESKRPTPTAGTKRCHAHETVRTKQEDIRQSNSDEEA